MQLGLQVEGQPLGALEFTMAMSWASTRSSIARCSSAGRPSSVRIQIHATERRGPTGQQVIHTV